MDNMNFQNGFIQLPLISDELATFLGINVGTRMSRVDVSREINAYIRTNSLEDPTDRTKINPDTKLSMLLGLSKKDKLTYFNIAKYVMRHYTN